MSHIKINYTNENGKRTSTTINKKIAFFYYISNINKINALPDDFEDKARIAIQNLLNDRGISKNKDDIESMLMLKIIMAERKDAREAVLELHGIVEPTEIGNPF